VSPPGDVDTFAVRTDGLTKRYGRTTVVDRVDLRIPPGVVYGLIGMNGAGKTTTFAMLAGLLRASSGTAEVAGITIAGRHGALRRRVGFMPDLVGVYDGLQVSEYLDFFAAAYDVPKRTRRALVDGLLELVELTGHRDAMVDSLSRGMKQRLSMARALVHDPDVLLLDEPASGLDPRSRRELWGSIDTLRTLGKTVVVSSHILPEMASACDVIGVMHGGRLLAQGTPDQLRADRVGSREVEVRMGDGAVERHRVTDDADQLELVRRLSAQDPRGVLEVRAVGSDLEELFLALSDAATPGGAPDVTSPAVAAGASTEARR
jgi:ABC-2 type transport system ATP-binding protein